jgi:hypothetical protein
VATAVESELVRTNGATCCAPAMKTVAAFVNGFSGTKFGEVLGIGEEIRFGICGLWELPTTWVTPGRVAKSSGARWA